MLPFFFWLVISIPELTAQKADPWADAMFLFEPGSGQNSGQGSDYFPQNIHGPPDSMATQLTGSADPAEIASIGLGGRIILQFTDNLIFDGPGPDFTVFENVFLHQQGPKAGLPFAEPAQVAVSTDGITFYAFPFDSLTLQGCAGVTPTNGWADPTKPDSSGGDSFDLTILGLDTVRFVELRDITAFIINDAQHPFWDPTLSGFDLDAIVAVNSMPVLPAAVHDDRMNKKSTHQRLQIYPNPANTTTVDHLKIRWQNRQNSGAKLLIYSIHGERIKRISPAPTTDIIQEIELSIRHWPAGSYFVKMDFASEAFWGRFQIVR